MEENNITSLIQELQNKYKDNLYMIQRLETHLSNLPTTLELEHKKHEERVSRFNELTMEQSVRFAYIQILFLQLHVLPMYF